MEPAATGAAEPEAGAGAPGEAGLPEPGDAVEAAVWPLPDGCSGGAERGLARARSSLGDANTSGAASRNFLAQTARWLGVSER